MSYSLTTNKTWNQTLDELEITFDKWGIRDWSVYPARVDSRKTWWGIDERRVTVTFKTRQGEERSFSMDKQQRPVDNLRVLFLAIEAIRMNEARGIGDLVREMYMALPAPAKVRDPYEVLGVRSDTPPAVIEAAYRALAKERHPDAGGSEEAFKELQAAYERIKVKS